VNKLPTSSPLRWRYNTEKANWKLFRDLVARRHTDSQPPGTASTGEKILHQNFVKSLQEAADKAIPRTRPTSRQYKDHWFYCSKVKELNHRVNMARKNYRRHPTIANRHLLQDIVKDTREEMKKNKTRKLAQIVLPTQ